MSKRTTIVLVAVVFIMAGAVSFIAARTVFKPAPKTNPDNVIELLADKANPSAVAVTKGDYVQFNSKDSKSHNIAQGNGEDHVASGQHTSGTKESGEFGANEGYRVQFNETGTYEFHDKLNPKIEVTVVVYEPKQSS